MSRSGLLLLASACHHLQQQSELSSPPDGSSVPPGGVPGGSPDDTSPSDASSSSPSRGIRLLSPPRSPGSILKLSDRRLLQSYASHIKGDMFACRLCPPSTTPFYAERTPMQMHLLQYHVFNAIHRADGGEYEPSLSRTKVRRLSAEASRRNAQMLDCPFVNWREIGGLVTEPVEPLTYGQVCKLGVALDHADYCKPVSENEPSPLDTPTKPRKRAPRKNKSLATQIKQEPQSIEPPQLVLQVTYPSLEEEVSSVAAEVEIASDTTPPSRVKTEPLSSEPVLTARSTYECSKCGREFKKKSNLLRHGTLFGCKVGAMQRRKRRNNDNIVVKTEEGEDDLVAYESLLPSPDTEVAAISRRLEAEDAILNAKCPSSYLPKSPHNDDADDASPSSNSVFSSPEAPPPPPASQNIYLTLPHFAAGPPPKEARITTPKKQDHEQTSPFVIRSPGQSPSNFLAGGSGSSFSVIKSRRHSDGEVGSVVSPRPPKRKPLSASTETIVNMRPFPVLSTCPGVVVRRPFLLPKVERKEERVMVEGIETVIVSTTPESSNNPGVSQTLPHSNSKLEQILRQGEAANIKMEKRD